MIRILGLSKTYGTQVLFDDVSLTVNRGERLGLVGRNGHGKSTLFRIFLGEEQPDSGDIDIPDNYRIGCLSQHLVFEHPTVLDEVESVLPELEGGWKPTYQAETVLQGLGFSTEQMQAAPEILSGGFQIRVNLAKLLASEADLLLLDEPTNYLDIVSIRWLATFLKAWKQELILITHDRHFMDSVITHVAGIHRQQIRKIAGATEKYYHQISLEEEIHEQSRQNQLKHRERTEDFIKRFRAKATKARAVQSRIKSLEREGSIEQLEEIEALEFAFRSLPFRGKHLLEVRGLSFAYDTPLMSNLTFSVKPRDRIAVIGPNGKGKSTLLQLLADELRPDAGTVSRPAQLRTAYFGQTNVQRLHLSKTIEEEILEALPEPNRTIARGLCGLMMFSGDAALKRISVLSGGERSRVLLGKILAAPANLLLLDEPTNHLDMQSAEALIDATAQFDGAVILVTHDEGLLRDFASKLIVFDRGAVTVFESGYDDFLTRVGWGDEPSPNSSSTTPESRQDKKLLRKMRADIVARRSTELKPMQKQIASIESKIMELEEQIETGNTALIDASKDGFGDAAAKLSREMHQWKQEVESLFEELEEITREHDQKADGFEQELQALASHSSDSSQGQS